jgi:hypothetical protein
MCAEQFDTWSRAGVRLGGVRKDLVEKFGRIALVEGAVVCK